MSTNITLLIHPFNSQNKKISEAIDKSRKANLKLEEAEYALMEAQIFDYLEEMQNDLVKMDTEKIITEKKKRIKYLVALKTKLENEISPIQNEITFIEEEIYRASFNEM
jgi:hypothetical protein